MNLDELESVWSSITPPITSGTIAGKRAKGLPNDRPVYLAVDDRGYRHLLVQIPDNTPAITQKGTLSLEVSTSRFEVGSNPESLCVDLACVDSSQNSTFNAVAQDLIRELQSSHGPLMGAVLSAIARWRAFWSSRTTGMNREEAIGLFGELWFMSRWLGPVTSTIIDCWRTIAYARHDFQWSDASVEVKTAVTTTEGKPVHQITNLDQLADPEQGDLFLFSLQVREDALSANTVHSLVNRIESELYEDFHGLTMFNEKLANRGYSPTDSNYTQQPLRILAENLYQVTNGFPRITRSTFLPNGPPEGIKSISYLLDLAACANWLIAATSTDSEISKIREKLYT